MHSLKPAVQATELYRCFLLDRLALDERPYAFLPSAVDTRTAYSPAM